MVSRRLIASAASGDRRLENGIHMALTRATSQEVGQALDRLGVIWSFDRDGDVRVAHQSNKQPWVDAAFYEFDVAKADFSMRGEFLHARFETLPDGMIQWELPADGPEPTAIARKIVSLYLMPRPEGVVVQVHATIESLAPARPIRIKLIPGGEQVSNIERTFPGFLGVSAGKNFWMSCPFRLIGY